MTRTAIVALEHGVRRDGTSVRLAELRPVTGEDELALAELEAPGHKALGMAACSTELLARTLARIGERPGASREEVRALSIGDRERLLLELYALSFGSTPELSSVCIDCREQLEFPVRVNDLILPPEPNAALEHAEDIAGAQVRFRLPNGDDQQAAADLAQSDPEAGARLLLERCLIEAPHADLGQLRALMAERLAALDPQAETVLEADCPACGAPARLLIDAAPLVFAKMAGTRRLMAEVDRIARAYHWSEREILALPATRRRSYLDLIAEGGREL
jgi:hypothetical protein